MNQLIFSLRQYTVPLIGVSFASLTVISFYLGIVPLLALPFGIALGLFTAFQIRPVYFLLLCSIPLSTEIYISSSLGTDLPDEPLMILLTGVSLLWMLGEKKAFRSSVLTAPLTVLLLLHYGWFLISGLQSVNPLVSFKIFLAKTWYIVPFYFLTHFIIRKEKDVVMLFWCLFIPTSITIIQTMLRHGLLYGFSFEDINKCTEPFYRNHVNYAALISVVFPLLLWAASHYPRGSGKRYLLIGFIVLFVAAIWFSFTRTCMLALLCIVPVMLVIRYRLSRIILPAVLIAAGLLIYQLADDYYYLRYAPDFNTTIYHDEFGDHMASTFEGKDVSSMERIYRWIGAARMFADRPIAGFGAGNFYPYYKQYTVSSFETWISDNPERSTVHNYFLLLLCEQGIVGFLIFLALCCMVFLAGETYYHQAQHQKQKRFILFMLVGLAMVFVNILLSDMLESDKVGPFFFLYLSLLVSAGQGAISFKEEGEQG